MRIFSMMLLLLLCNALYAQGNSAKTEKKEIGAVLDAWHKAAAEADFEAYFSGMTADGVFIGTDATENWQNHEFRAFSKPYFDRGKAWSFTSVARNIYVDDALKIAWFDELLSTWMGICRGSGVLKKTDKGWKIAHYVLSIAIPNDDVEKVVQLKTAFDEALLKKLKEKQ